MPSRAISRFATIAVAISLCLLSPPSLDAQISGQVCQNGWFDIQTYGAVPNDGLDDRAAIQAAIDAADQAGGGTVCIPGGVYELASQAVPDPGFTNPFAVLLWLRDGVSISGIGTSSVLKVADGMNSFDPMEIPPTGYARTGGFLVMRHPEGATIADQRLEDVTLSRFTIDGNAANNPMPDPLPSGGTYYRHGRFVEIFYGSRITLKDCRFVNSNSRQIVHIGTDGPDTVDQLVMRNNVFEDHAQQAVQNDHSSIYSVALGATIEDNVFDNTSAATNGARVATAIEVHGSQHVVQRNTVRFYKVGANVAATVTDPVGNQFLDNDFSISTGFSFWVFADHTMNDVLIRGNRVEEAFFEDPWHRKSRLVRFLKVQGAIHDLVIEDNEFLSTVTGIDPNRKTTGISVHGYAKDLILRNNTIRDTPCEAIDIHGPKPDASPGPNPDIDGLEISGNTITNAGSWGALNSNCSSAISIVMPQTPVLRNASIVDNSITYQHAGGNHDYANLSAANNAFRLHGGIVDTTITDNEVTGQIDNDFSFNNTTGITNLVIDHHDQTSSTSPASQSVFACTTSTWKTSAGACWKINAAGCSTLWTSVPCFGL